jgi:hypothetical protein
MMMQETPQKRKFPASQWIKRFGFAGFMFFLVKGLVLYIIIPILIAYFAW